MSLLESIRLAFGSLRANKLRAVLTMLGIIIGVGSVIALLAFGNGYGAFLDAELARSMYSPALTAGGPTRRSRRSSQLLTPRPSGRPGARRAWPHCRRW
jgi:hypothetical protein